jgi:hypothetical protein
MVIAFGWLAGCTNSSGPPPAVSTAPAAPATGVVPALEPTPALAQAAEPQAPPALDSPDQPAAPEKNPEQPANAASGQDPAKPRRILGQKTSDIRDAQKEEAKGAQRVQPRVTGQDPISISGNAYISIVGRTEVLQIQHTLDLFHAETGRYPKDLKEFMTEIINKNRIRLAQLPFYQEYGYDAANHQLVILEYPDRKAAAGR